MKIESGVTRTVFIFNRFVIKIPCIDRRYLKIRLRKRNVWGALYGVPPTKSRIFVFAYWILQGMKTNRREHVVSGALRNTNRLAPSVFCVLFGLLLVMKRAEQPRNFKRKQMNRYLNKFAEFDPDGKPCNFGFIGRRLVLVDYGEIELTR